MIPSRQEHGYVSVGDRLVHYVRRGRGPVVVLQHASPGDARSLGWLVDALSDEYCVLALDTPGHGLSDPLDAVEPEIPDYGQALLDTLAALGLHRVHLYGTHTGAKIALSSATTAQHRVSSLILDGVGVSTEAERADQLASYTPTFAPQSDGSHLIRAWHQARNMFLFWPWYAERPDHMLRDAMPPIDELHDIAHGMVRAGARYGVAYRAAFRCDPSDLLGQLSVRTTIAASPDDPLHAHLERIGALPAGVRVEAAPIEHTARAGWVRATLLQDHDLATSTDQALRAAPTQVRRRFVPTSLGDVHVSMDEHGADTIVIVAFGETVDAMPGSATMVVELPGTGRSTLASDAELDTDRLLRCLCEVSAACGVQPTAVRASGTGTALAHALAHAFAAATEVIDDAAGALPGELPDLTPRPDGAHLLAAWHFARDRALQHLTNTGRWPAGGDELDLELIQSATVSLTGSWPTLPGVYAACRRADSAAATTTS